MATLMDSGSSDLARHVSLIVPLSRRINEKQWIVALYAREHLA